MTSNEFPHPLRLAVGSHTAGSGKGCAMNVISWENGDQTITDLPECADPFLAKVVQSVNDSYCKHTDQDMLCAPCSIEVLELAHRTVGTRLDPEPRTVWVTIAAEEALSVLPLFESQRADDDRPRKAIEAALAWAKNPSEKNKAAAAAAYAAYAAADAANAAANAAADAAAAYAAAAYAADAASGDRLTRAHHIIDRYLHLTGLTETTPDPAKVTAAILAMTR